VIESFKGISKITPVLSPKAMSNMSSSPDDPIVKPARDSMQGVLMIREELLTLLKVSRS